MYWSNHMSTGGWILSIVWTVIIVALVVAGIVWLMSALSARGADGTASTRAQAPAASVREILDRRLASGEITIEQYEQLRDALGDQTPPAMDSRPSRPAGVAT